MIAKDRLTSGTTSGSYSTTTTDDDSDSYSTTSYSTTTSDPFSGGSGGKTGSEIIAEGGAPEAVATVDPHADSVTEKIEKDGLSNTWSTFTDLAHDADDGDTVQFDHIPDTQEGRETIQDTINSFVGAAQQAAESNSGATDVIPENLPGDVPARVGQLGSMAKFAVFATVALVAAVALGGN